MTGEPSGDADADDADEVEVNPVHPFQARKRYLCPGCQQEIPPGLGHLVVVPRRSRGLRRHWHRACWEHRHRRRPGR
jgi:hypothetical protein